VFHFVNPTSQGIADALKSEEVKTESFKMYNQAKQIVTKFLSVFATGIPDTNLLMDHALQRVQEVSLHHPGTLSLTRVGTKQTHLLLVNATLILLI
jgi:hypothetical protein